MLAISAAISKPDVTLLFMFLSSEIEPANKIVLADKFYTNLCWHFLYISLLAAARLTTKIYICTYVCVQVALFEHNQKTIIQNKGTKYWKWFMNCAQRWIFGIEFNFCYFKTINFVRDLVTFSIFTFILCLFICQSVINAHMYLFIIITYICTYTRIYVCIRVHMHAIVSLQFAVVLARPNRMNFYA